MRKPARLRHIATEDFDEITDFYVDEAGPSVARRFGAALAADLDRLELNSGIGSPAVGQWLGRAGLRTWRVRGFPYLVCYFERPDHVDVWRILHGARDLGGLLGEEPDSDG